MTGETRSADKPADGDFDYGALDGSQEDEQPVWFAAQTIQNACGTQAILSVLMNQTEDTVRLGPSLSEFREFTSAFPAEVSSICAI